MDATVGGNIQGVSNDIWTSPYALQDQPYPEPRVKAYTGWANYKNVKSGQYNREICAGQCLGFKGFPQDPGVYDLNIDNRPAPKLDYPAMNRVNDYYQVYQYARLQNQPLSNVWLPGQHISSPLNTACCAAGTPGSNYTNYLNNPAQPNLDGSGGTTTFLYPKQYIKGYWPDEQLS